MQICIYPGAPFAGRQLLGAPDQKGAPKEGLLPGAPRVSCSATVYTYTVYTQSKDTFIHMHTLRPK